MNSPVRLGVSPAAASTPMGVLNLRFDALFPHAGDLGCTVCLAPVLFLPAYLRMDVGLQDLPAAAWPAPFHNLPPGWICQLPPCRESSLPQLPISAPPTGLDECFCFISLVVGLIFVVIFYVSSGCFLFLNCCCPSFGCARRHSVSTYASILS